MTAVSVGVENLIAFMDRDVNMVDDGGSEGAMYHRRNGRLPFNDDKDGSNGIGSDGMSHAGLKPELHYDKRMSPMRARVRRALLPVVRAETDVLVSIQSSLRHVFLDWYFSFLSNLGTHTFFLVCLPMLFWFGYAPMARGLTLIIASGVFCSGFVKDLLCLPRPLSPPIHRLTMTTSHNLEYGFPSTHTTNAVSVTLYLLTFVLAADDIEVGTRYLYISALMLYCLGIVFGRIYCGMHSITDVVGGTVLGTLVWGVQWSCQDQINDFLLDNSYFTPAAIVLLGLFLVYVFPEPVDNCPCFEDCVAFAGVMIGLLPGSWRFAHSDYSLAKANIPYDLDRIGLLISLCRILLGVTVLFAWRMVMKKVLYMVLPPFYRVLSLPARKDYLPANDYKTLAGHKISPFPSIISIPSAPMDSIGPQSKADEYEQLDVKFENAQKESSVFIDGQSGPAKGSAAVCEHQMNGHDKPRHFVLLTHAEDPPLRYDVDVVVRLIVYAGIGWLVVDAIPVLFEVLGMGISDTEGL